MTPSEEKSLVERIPPAIGVITAAMLSVGAFRLLLLGERYNIGIFNYLSFPNLLEYSFGAVRTLLWDTIPFVGIFLIFETAFTKLIDRWHYSIFATLCLMCALTVGFFYYNSKCFPITQNTAYFLTLLLQIGIFSMWKLLKKCPATNKLAAKILLSIGFLFLFVKIDTAVDISSIEHNANTALSIITYKDASRNSDTLRGKRYISLGTNDFVFVQDDITHSVTAIPMSEIHSISTGNIFQQASFETFAVAIGIVVVSILLISIRKITSG